MILKAGETYEILIERIFRFHTMLRTRGEKDQLARNTQESLKPGISFGTGGQSLAYAFMPGHDKWSSGLRLQRDAQGRHIGSLNEKIILLKSNNYVGEAWMVKLMQVGALLVDQHPAPVIAQTTLICICLLDICSSA